MKSKCGQIFVQTSDFMVKGLMNSDSLNHHDFRTKTDVKEKIMKVNIFFYAKLCT